MMPQPCPPGKIQLQFVGCDGARHDNYSWAPGGWAFLEIRVDNTLYRLDIGTFHDGKSERRGFHIVGPVGIRCEATALNAVSIWQEPFPKEPTP